MDNELIPTNNSFHVVTWIKDHMFPIAEWGHDKVRNVAIGSLVSALLVYWVLSNVLSNRPEELDKNIEKENIL